MDTLYKEAGMAPFEEQLTTVRTIMDDLLEDRKRLEWLLSEGCYLRNMTRTIRDRARIDLLRSQPREIWVAQSAEGFCAFAGLKSEVEYWIHKSPDRQEHFTAVKYEILIAGGHAHDR